MNNIGVRECCTDMFMISASQRLKELRKSAVPRLTVRGIADELGIPFGTYSNYESPRYKKRSLPLDLTRRIAAILAQHRVDPSEVMKLAGLSAQEVEPEAREIEAQRPTIQFVSFPVALPSEVALRDMFESLLSLVPQGATRAETAQILARRLPAGFAGIGPFTVDQTSAAYDAKLDGEAAGAGEGAVERR